MQDFPVYLIPGRGDAIEDNVVMRVVMRDALKILS